MYVRLATSTLWIVSGLREEWIGQREALRLITQVDDVTVLADKPRYEECAQLVPEFVEQGGGI